MIFTETPLEGAYLIVIEPIWDNRGFFARSWCRDEFAERGLVTDFVQCNISYNQKKGTLRGMHYQIAPHEEVKIVRCTRGSIYDVIVDLRPESNTYKQWFSVELSANNRKMLYIPEGMAHGFQTLEYNAEVFYQMGEYYTAECSRGVRWNDPAFGIRWLNIGETIISERDKSFADFSE